MRKLSVQCSADLTLLIMPLQVRNLCYHCVLLKFKQYSSIFFLFLAYYTIEQTLKVIALGKIYFFNLNMVYDGIITVALLVVELVQLGIYGGM